MAYHALARSALGPIADENMQAIRPQRDVGKVKTPQTGNASYRIINAILVARLRYLIERLWRVAVKIQRRKTVDIEIHAMTIDREYGE